jgi:hypothetical protein
MAKEPKIVLLSVAPLHKVKTKKRHRWFRTRRIGNDGGSCIVYSYSSLRAD